MSSECHSRSFMVLFSLFFLFLWVFFPRLLAIMHICSLRQGDSEQQACENVTFSEEKSNAFKKQKLDISSLQTQQKHQPG